MAQGKHTLLPSFQVSQGFITPQYTRVPFLGISALAKHRAKLKLHLGDKQVHTILFFIVLN